MSGEELNPLTNFWMEGDSLAPPCQVDEEVIEDILKFANLSESSCIFDLGCGDGRVCVAATKNYNCYSCGVEIEERLIVDFAKNVENAGLENKVKIIHDDLRNVDLTSASVIYTYLLPEAIISIKSILKEAVMRGSLLICNTWGPKDWVAVDIIHCGPFENCKLLKYTVESILYDAL